ncbi:MAG TPA: hypothetical protein VG916_07510 [Gemmatimonadaceae bacterium]|nr:hypothetical protein [Gemmatimonadaceae bacterium]
MAPIPAGSSDEIRGWTMCEGILAHQHAGFHGVFAAFLAAVAPVRILEIGTADGGTILSLKRLLPSADIRSYDTRARDTHAAVRAAGVDIRIENIFTDTYDRLRPDGVDDVAAFIQADGVTVVLCDGGNKKGEFNSLSDLLKPGDFIMAHDYAESLAHFNARINNRIWKWCELTEDDIRDASARNHLEPYMGAEFEAVVWVCKRKVR